MTKYTFYVWRKSTDSRVIFNYNVDDINFCYDIVQAMFPNWIVGMRPTQRITNEN